MALQFITRHYAVLKESLAAAWEAEQLKRANDNTAFLPAALEVLETPPNPLGRIILWVIMGFLSLALLWACFGQIDVVATAQGRVLPEGNIKTVQAPDQGVVRAIHVRDGQRVREGDALIELDPTVSEAEVEQAREALQVAQVDRARAQALLNFANGSRAAIEWPEGLDSQIRQTQEAIVAARIAEHRAQRAGAAQERAQRSADRAMVAADIARLEQQVPLAEQQLQAFQGLQERGFAPRLRVAEVEERTIGMRSDLTIRRAELGRARAAEGAAAQTLASIDAQFRREALDAFNEADATGFARKS